MAVLANRIPTITLLLSVLSTASVALHAAPSDEYALKAIYIYNFAKFTEWPAESFDSGNAMLNLCILGEDPFGVEINEISGKKVRSRTLNIKRYPRVAVVSGCNILFISRSEFQRLDLILKDIVRLPILTISDINGFSDRGGMVTLMTQDQSLHFAINQHTVTLSGIKISSKLLELATAVVGRHR